MISIIFLKIGFTGRLSILQCAVVADRNDYVKIKMNQTTSDASVTFFALPVALKFKNATQQKTIVVDNKSNEETFYKNIGFIADTVIVDPDYWLITKNNTSEKVKRSIPGQI